MKDPNSVSLPSTGALPGTPLKVERFSVYRRSGGRSSQEGRGKCVRTRPVGAEGSRDVPIEDHKRVEDV